MTFGFGFCVTHILCVWVCVCVWDVCLCKESGDTLPRAHVPLDSTLFHFRIMFPVFFSLRFEAEGLSWPSFVLIWQKKNHFGRHFHC